jgi:hypothetical protein
MSTPIDPAAMVAAAKPCPFCGSTTIGYGEWYLDSGIEPAIECERCFAGAPFEAWQKRARGDMRVLTTTDAALLEVALRGQAKRDSEEGDQFLAADATRLEELAALIRDAESVTVQQILDHRDWSST